MPLKYPELKKEADQMTELCDGRRIPDPYRWLESPDSDETKSFVAAQNTLFDSYMATQQDGKDSCRAGEAERIKKHLTRIWNYERHGCLFFSGGETSETRRRYFQFYNSGLQNQSVLLCANSPEELRNNNNNNGGSRIFLDPNSWSEDGTVALASYEFSHDGSLLAYTISENGSDWNSLRVLRVEDRVCALTSSPDTANPSAATAAAESNSKNWDANLPDRLEKLKHSCLSWTKDNRGFFYNAYPHLDDTSGTKVLSTKHQKLMYHVLGTDQSQDFICWQDNEHPEWLSSAEVTECGRFVILTIRQSCDRNNLLYFCDLDAIGQSESRSELERRRITGPEKLEWQPLVDKFEALFSFVTNEDDLFTIRTSLDNLRYRLVKIRARANPPPEAWRNTFLTGTPSAPPPPSAAAAASAAADDATQAEILHWACHVARDKLVVCFQANVRHVLRVYSLHQSGDSPQQQPIRSIELPICSVSGFYGQSQSSELFFSITSQVIPGVVYRCQFDDVSAATANTTTDNSSSASLQLSRIVETRLNAEAKLRLEDFQLSQEFCASEDGTRIPMYIMRQTANQEAVAAAAAANQPIPCCLYGYGGFGISLMPAFSVLALFFVRQFGGAYVTANIRGGGEFGKAWHEAGRLAHKHRCFQDFIAVAQHLTRPHDGITAPHRLFIHGASNGGTLVAACLNARPDLFGAVVCQVGVLDMLRFHRFTIGHAWVSDFGDPEKRDDLDYILKYSPLHNIGGGNDGGQSEAGAPKHYPAVLLITADHDDRVVPLHSFKFIAQLQETMGGAPRTITGSDGASAGETTRKALTESPLLIQIEVKAGHGAGKPVSKRIEEYSTMFAFVAKALNLKQCDADNAKLNDGGDDEKK